ncbi:uncharacterized protein J3D65DRAFT_625365 [Phyllosticta citribraziliensis]|uniref:DUF7924 domain-containing protein n=1 Tax=Phyllosticta citribraziliensis TaxID=989973 RepID=A0ABR1LRU1_9PEZI
MARPASAQSPQSYRSATPTRGERHQGIKKASPSRRSARVQQSLPPLKTSDRNGSDDRLQPTLTQPAGEKRKRSRERATLDQPTHERQRSLSFTTEAPHEETASESSGTYNNPIDYWRKHLHWPQRFFESGSKMSHLLARKKSPSTPRRNSPASSIASPSTQSDQRPRELKSAQYRDSRYDTLLASHGSFMREDVVGISQESKMKYMALLSGEQAVPERSLFSDDLFKSACQKIESQNEARVIRDISLLLVPSAETLETYGASNLKCLVESTNAGWNNSIPITNPRPQPDYAVGFRREAFTADQLKLLDPFFGTAWDESYFAATWYMYFPFLTCEVKCGAVALEIADRQNAHSATLAVRSVVELFRLVKREKEIDREILAFSISHSHDTVRIYGHYPVIEGKETKYYRHLIDKFHFTARDGKEKWTAYKFTKNIYDKWMPDHLKRISSAVDEIPPDLNFDVPQDQESQHHSELEGSASVPGHGSASGVANADDATPDTSASREFKKPRRL